MEDTDEIADSDLEADCPCCGHIVNVLEVCNTGQCPNPSCRATASECFRTAQAEPDTDQSVQQSSSDGSVDDSDRSRPIDPGDGRIVYPFDGQPGMRAE